MASYLLDTTVLIDHLRGSPAVAEYLESLVEEAHQVGVCGVNIAELFAGIRPENRTLASGLIERLEYYEITPEAARTAGTFIYDFARRGRSLSTADALIAGVAMDRGAILVTANVRDFPMPELRVVPQPRDYDR
ncbi:MAG: type II toxin-antitoxin system VapC family toxin [Chloroflexi bacterium]|nr:type II toxin-antitoxin system VapC family toxin [Chloroflexota bacterium]